MHRCYKVLIILLFFRSYKGLMVVSGEGPWWSLTETTMVSGTHKVWINRLLSLDT